MSLYTPRQLLLVLLIVGAAGAGLAIDHVRRARPDLVERLERLDRAEPAAPRSSPATPTAEAPSAPRVVPGPARDADRDPPSGDRATDRRSDGVRARRGRALPSAEPIDINRADEPELVRLPGVGPALAARIIAARPFADVDDLRRVRGLRAPLFERLKPLVVAAP
jgi:competence protein ComEA